MKSWNAKGGGFKPRATTQEVVGPSAGEEKVPREWEKFRRHLLELRDHLTRRQSDLSNDALEEQPSFSTHMADAGTDTFDRDLALSLLSSEQDALYQIDAALDRIRNRTYGVCELSGKPIARERLEAIPWTRFSAEAEREVEKQGVRKLPRLGSRKTVTGEGQPDGNREAA